MRKVDDEIANVLDCMEKIEVGDDKYMASLIALKTLYEIKKDDNDKIRKETWLLVGTNLLGIALVLFHEQANVISSKAFTLIRKLF